MRVSATAWNTPPTAIMVSALDSPVLLAAAAIRSFLFTVTLFEISGNGNCLQGFWVCGFMESNSCATPASIRARAELKARSGFEVRQIVLLASNSTLEVNG